MIGGGSGGTGGSTGLTSPTGGIGGGSSFVIAGLSASDKPCGLICSAVLEVIAVSAVVTVSGGAFSAAPESGFAAEGGRAGAETSAMPAGSRVTDGGFFNVQAISASATKPSMAAIIGQALKWPEGGREDMDEGREDMV